MTYVGQEQFSAVTAWPMGVRCSGPTVQALLSWEALGGAGENGFQCKDAENCS